jgi:6-phosphogluconate dehydrogenase
VIKREAIMELGIIGLGRMGSNMAKRLLKAGHHVIVYDPIKEAIDTVVEEGAIKTASISELVQKSTEPCAIWLMVPSGEPTENVINTLATLLSEGDIIIDGGNSNYKDSVRRAAALSMKGIIFLDVGTSGGIWGLQEGYSLMVGGDMEAFRRLEPIFQSLAPSPEQGYGHVGPSGAGHFVKMIHNGIEYGLMQSYAEGFELMQAKQEFNLNLAQVAEIWRYGSVVRSWMLDLAALHRL